MKKTNTQNLSFHLNCNFKIICYVKLSIALLHKHKRCILSQNECDSSTGKLVSVCSEYKAVKEDEFSLKYGETLILKEKCKDGRSFVFKHGRNGYIPSSCILDISGMKCVRIINILKRVLLTKCELFPQFCFLHQLRRKK